MNNGPRKELAEKINLFFRGFYTPVEEIQKADLLQCFGRSDLRLVGAAAGVWSRRLATNLLFTGGLGKDSGPILKKLKLPEASFLGYKLYTDYGVPLECIFVENESTNGAENCRNSIALTQEQGLPFASTILLGYPASLFRLYRMMVTAGRRYGYSSKYQLLASPGPENLNVSTDQDELIAEFLRLVEWPDKGWLDPCELPNDIVDAVLSMR